MATFRLPRFSSPEVLRAVDRRRLAAFLAPHREFFLAHGITLPEPETEADPAADPDYDALVRAFMSPDDGTPADLIDALYHVDGMATPEGMADLIEAARDARVELDAADDVTPADVAVQVWLRNSDLLERKHAEQYLTHPKSFEYYPALIPHPEPFAPPAMDAVTRLEGALNDWFEGHKRGRTARVFAFPRLDATWFLVRHGEPYKREESVVGAEPSSVNYRPLRYDVLAYTAARGELRVHAKLKGERRLYREEFGRHLFGGPNHFLPAGKYTLEPLRSDGAAALACPDVPGIEWVRLKELHLNWGGPHGEYEVRRATDLFAALRDRGQSIPEAAGLARAGFAVKFAGVKRPRTVAVKPPNTALYQQDEDGDRVEEWLAKRGFVNAEAGDDDRGDGSPAADPVLASP